MRYFRSTFLNPKILNSQAHNNFYLLGFPRSKPAFLSTFSSPSSTLHQTPNPGIPVSQSWRHTTFACESSSPEQPPPPPPPKLAPTERISGIVDEVSGLTLMETMDLFELVRQKMGMGTDVIPTMFVMMPGMGFGGKSAGKSTGGGAASEEKKAEKTAFDLKLEGFDAASKIKIIKEVRTFTDLGLKEAKDLVEKAPTLLKKGVLKEEAEKIIQKMKDLGAKVVME